MNDTTLVIGAGPVGLAAALFLADQGMRTRIVDAAPQAATESRAQVVNPRALELLESTGVAQAMVAQGRAIHRTRFYDDWKLIAELEFAGAHPRYRMTILSQARSEALLAQALRERGVVPERGVQLDALRQEADYVEATLIHVGGRREVIRSPLLLGADGAHSRVREQLGIAFEGSAFPEAWPLADTGLETSLDLDSAHVCFLKDGLVFLLGLEGKLWRVFGNVPDILDHLPPGTTHVGPTAWTSSFHISHRLAAMEAVGRVAIAGDAAHIHSPVAARGMNLGIEDAWVYAHCAADFLADQPGRLGDYGRLRHAVHEKVVSHIKLLTELARGRPDLVGLLRDHLIPGLTKFGPSAHAMVALLTGLDSDVRLH
ncbi:FAD-dependent oxidoreductase [Paraburkholderia sp. BR14263]|uniref:FAD-dependent oxidoreductase n=1 Tax=unclassified Paraburkholderia TaxID=2615204 RepID=UPI0034CD186A